MSYLVQLVIILILTKIGAHLSNMLNFPSVIGELLVGVVAGPAVLNILTGTTFIQYFSEIGLIVLMFIAGLEGDLHLLMKFWKPALTVAILGVIFPTITAAGLCALFFGFKWTTAIFIGLVLSATSVSISVQVLKEMGKMNTKEGAIILGAAVADDIICVILLGICVAFFGSAASSNQPLWLMISTKLLFFVLMLVLGRYFVPRFMNFFSKLNTSENEATGAVILCFGFAAIAVALGMSDVLGAYFAGIALSETKYQKSLAQKIEPIGYAIFIPVFFVSIGLNITFKGLQNDIVFIIALIVIAILGKQIGGALGAKMFGLNWSESNIVGAGMVSRGEMALVVANVALGAKLIDQNHYTAMILVTVVTTIIAPLILKFFIQRSTNNSPVKKSISSQSINEVKI